MSDKSNGPAVGQAKAGDEEQKLLRKRQSLKTIGRFAAYTAPAMVVLLKADESTARHGGRGRGRGPFHGGGGGGGGRPCDNPGRHLGWNNNRHSPC